MSEKVIVDREYLSSQIEDVLEVIYYVEQGYSYSIEEQMFIYCFKKLLKAVRETTILRS